MVEIPKEPRCTDCVLQFVCKTFQGTFYQCSDIQISSAPSQTCVGKCGNGGVCDGNLCKCKKNYYGTYCENKQENEEKSSFGVFVLFVVLLMITSVLLAVLYYWKNPEKIPKVVSSLMIKHFRDELDENPEEPYKKVVHEDISIEVKQ